MSWGEVKKINSDLNVPLDERMGYVGGIIPRGTVQKQVTKQISYSDGVFNGEILSVNGKGALASAVVTCYAGSTTDAYSACEIDIDDGSRIITIGDITTNTTKGKAGFYVDLSASFSDIGVMDESEISIPADAYYTVNKPILFEKSLKVTAKLFTKKVSASTCSINYALL